MTLAELIASQPEYATAKALAIILTPEQAQTLADTQAAHGNPRHVAQPVPLTDGTLFLCGDLLMEIGPGGLYHKGFDKLPQEMFAQIPIKTMAEAVALIPEPEPLEEAPAE